MYFGDAGLAGFTSLAGLTNDGDPDYFTLYTCQLRRVRFMMEVGRHKKWHLNYVTPRATTV